MMTFFCVNMYTPFFKSATFYKNRISSIRECDTTDETDKTKTQIVIFILLIFNNRNSIFCFVSNRYFDKLEFCGLNRISENLSRLFYISNEYSFIFKP